MTFRHQKASFQAFKQKSDGFVRAVNALPETAPKIDFDAYRSKISVAGMVDDFQAKYEALDIPYPKDNATAALDAQLVTKKAEYTKFVAESEAKVAEIQTELDKWEKMRPFSEMTTEEFARQAPHLMTKLGQRDPAQHRHSFAQLDTTTMKFHFNETYDQRKAERALLPGTLFSANEALNVGLVDDVASTFDDTIELCRTYLNGLAKSYPSARAMSKSLVRKPAIEALKKQFNEDVDLYAKLIMSETFQKAADAHVKAVMAAAAAKKKKK